MRVGSLFSGYGGLDMAVGGTSVPPPRGASSSTSTPACWPSAGPGVPNYGDVTAVDWSAVEAVDIHHRRVPCQDVSTPAYARGVQRHPLRLVGTLRLRHRPSDPDWWILENVADYSAPTPIATWNPAVGVGRRTRAIRALEPQLSDLAEAGSMRNGAVFARPTRAPHRRAPTCPTRRGTPQVPSDRNVAGNGGGDADGLTAADAWSSRHGQRPRRPEDWEVVRRCAHGTATATATAKSAWRSRPAAAGDDGLRPPPTTSRRGTDRDGYTESATDARGVADATICAPTPAWRRRRSAGGESAVGRMASASCPMGAAIRRWGSQARATEPQAADRLSPRFVEWMLGRSRHRRIPVRRVATSSRSRPRAVDAARGATVCGAAKDAEEVRMTCAAPDCDRASAVATATPTTGGPQMGRSHHRAQTVGHRHVPTQSRGTRRVAPRSRTGRRRIEHPLPLRRRDHRPVAHLDRRRDAARRRRVRRALADHHRVVGVGASAGR